MKDNRILLLFSLVLLIMVSLSAVSAADSHISNGTDSNLGEDDNSFIEVDSCSSFKYSLGDIESNDLDYDADSDGLGTDSKAVGLLADSEDGDSGNDDFENDGSENDGSENDGSENDGSENDGSGSSIDSGNGSSENDGSGTDLENETIDFSNRSDYLFLISPQNYDIFFDENNVLREDYGGCTLVFEGYFTDMGTFDIAYPYTRISARENLFNNTAFRVSASDVQLTNLNIILDRVLSENDYAGILVLANNVSIYNITMNYTVPEATNGFLVYSEGSGLKLENLSIINSTFYFTGNNLNEGWDYGIFIDHTDSASVYGNRIDSYLPLRAVDWSSKIYGGVSMDAAATIVVQNSDFLRVFGNEINAYVHGGGSDYLDACLFYNCKNLTIDQNDIHMEDIDSKDGKENYIQATDFYFCDDVTFVMNSIDVATTGGKAGFGAAYPVKVNGPANNIKIAFNDLATFNYGPNCGIYSQNQYGDTHIDIISNFINVTGLASSHYRGLVAGIEVQDSDDRIWNNTIVVRNLASGSSDHVYGISYSQSAGGNHTYDIQFNNVTTNGRYAVEFNGTNSMVVNSVIANNVLNANSSRGNAAIFIGNHKNVTVRNNNDSIFKNMLDDSRYPEWLSNFLGNHNVHTAGFKWVTEAMSNASNGTGFDKSEGNSSGVISEGGNDTIGNNSNGTDSLIEGNETGNGTGNGTAGNSTEADPIGGEGDGDGNHTDTNSTNNETNQTETVNETDSDPIHETEPINNTNPLPDVPLDSVNETNADNETEPVNETELNETEPVNHTEVINNTEPVNHTEVINNTDTANNTNMTETIENDTNQTLMEDDDLDPKESHETNPDDEETPSNDNQKSNPGDSDAEMIDSNDPVSSQKPEDSQTRENEEELDNPEDADSSPSAVGDSHSDSASSPGLSGASAANDAYELDRKVEDLVSKSVDYLSLAGICVFALLLILVGYKRQKDIEEED